MSRGRVFTLLLVIILLLAGCGANKSYTYTLVSTDVYVVGGEKLKGSSSVRATLFVSDRTIEDDVSVELEYAGKTYSGTIHGSFVFWDREPYIFADASSTYTKISGGGNEIRLTFCALVGGIWFESRQVYNRR